MDSRWAGGGVGRGAGFAVRRGRCYYFVEGDAQLAAVIHDGLRLMTGVECEEHQ